MRLKDNIHLRHGRLSLVVHGDLHPALAQARALFLTWKQIGGLLKKLSAQHGMAPAAALAVWNVESGDLPFVSGKPVLRLECHKLWECWGQGHSEVFDRHFQFGGRGGISGVSWMNHRFKPTGFDWQVFHGNQRAEYRAFALARRLAGLEAACWSSSFGGPQIMGFNHAKLGYPDSVSLCRAFGKSLRAQVLGFFDFCHSENLFPALQARDWHAFARIYNGPSRTNSYAEKINDAFLLAHAIVAADRQALAEVEGILTFDHAAFAKFFDTLGTRNFTAREFLFRGRENSAPSSAAYGLNRYPPQKLWPNIASVAKAVDAFRGGIGAPVTLQSIYRTAAYNSATGGSAGSQHTLFAAVDLQVMNASSPTDWAGFMRRIREQGVFKGAIGLHDHALHIDARGENVDL